MKNFFTLLAIVLVSFVIPQSAISQVKLPTYITGAPIRPGNLTGDDRVELQEAGVVPNEDKDGNERSAAAASSPFQAGTSKAQACASSSILATPYNTNNGQRGCMFNVFAANTVTVRCFEANLYSGTTANYEIYYRAGSHVGFENNSAAWTFIGGATGITSAGNNVPTALPIPVNVTIPAGMTYSFYVTNDFGGGTSYTDGAAVGNFLAGDANLTVYEGVGKSYPFGLTFTVRNFNGTIFYDLGGTLDAETATLTAVSNSQGVNLDWQIGGEQQFTSFSLQRSEDGLRFADIASWTAAENPASYLDGAISSDQYLYRLRLLDQEGIASFSNVVEVQTESTSSLELESAYPNPFSGTLNLKIRSREVETLQVQILNPVGQVVARREMHIGMGSNQVALDFPELSTGLYTLQLQGKKSSLVQKIICN